MNTEVEKKQKSFLKEKMMRFKPVVLIKENIFLFSFFLIFSLSLLFGLWNINRYEIVNTKGKDMEKSVVEEIEGYFKEHLESSNYFLFSPREFQESMYSDITLLKSIRIEKVLPNKIVLFVEIHQPKYVAELSSNLCFLLSSEGFVLEEILEDDTEGGEELCLNYARENTLIYFFSEDMEISVLENGKRRLLLMEDINKVVETVETFNYKIVRINLENAVLKIYDESDRVFTFSTSDDIPTQLKRFLIVIAKIKNDSLEFGSLDLRFERPAMRE